MCKCAVSLLTPPPAEEAEGVVAGGGGDEGAAGGGEDGNKQDVGDGGSAFPLDIDQEVSVLCSKKSASLVSTLFDIFPPPRY